jgi:hypothetical protein
MPVLKNFCHRDGILNAPFRLMLTNALATFAIAFEQPHRRVDITYYCMPRSVEILWNMLKNRRLVRKDFPF